MRLQSLQPLPIGHDTLSLLCFPTQQQSCFWFPQAAGRRRKRRPVRWCRAFRSASERRGTLALLCVPHVKSTRFLASAGSWAASKAQPGQVVLRFPRPLPEGRGTLSLRFHYKLRASLSGFYLASSTSELVLSFHQTDPLATSTSGHPL